MTNKLLLLAAAGALAFASCQTETGGGMNDEMMQAKVDSAVQARMAEMQAQLAAQNDSLINAMAMMKADSMMAATAAAGNNNAGARRTVPARPNTSAPTTAPAAPTTSNDKATKFDRLQGKEGSNTATKAETEEKKSKFDRMKGGN